VSVEINTLRGMMRTPGFIVRRPSVRLCAGAALWCAFAPMAPVGASPLSEKARESKCIDKPVAKGGELYTCSTDSGVVTYFNVPGAGEPTTADRGGKRNASSPAPAGFPRVDGETQKVRDDVRRKVLADELAAEQKLLVEARAAYADGAPAPLPEERTDAEKYRIRIGKLRTTVTVHERNIEALKKELTLVK
jgi:hypothetical protein